MYKLFIQASAVIFATLITTYPGKSWEVFYIMASFQNFLPVKFAFYSVLVFLGIPTYQKIMKGRTMGLIEGVPVIELLDHLFTYRTFKRDEIEEKFWVSRAKYAKIADRLDRHGFFERWANNERILSQITREHASRLLVSPTEPVVVKIIDRVIALLDAVRPVRNPEEPPEQTDWNPVRISEVLDK